MASLVWRRSDKGKVHLNRLIQKLLFVGTFVALSESNLVVGRDGFRPGKRANIERIATIINAENEPTDIPENAQLKMEILAMIEVKALRKK